MIVKEAASRRCRKVLCSSLTTDVEQQHCSLLRMKKPVPIDDNPYKEKAIVVSFVLYLEVTSDILCDGRNTCQRKLSLQPVGFYCMIKVITLKMKSKLFSKQTKNCGSENKKKKT